MAATPPAGGGGAGPGEHPKPADTPLGKFDPADLEKGASSLKEIDASKFADQIFDLVRLQENTLQLGHRLSAEKERTQRAEFEHHLSAAQAEESRRTISHMADQERTTAQRKAEVESALQSKKLEQQQEKLDYQLRREQEQFMQHESIRIGNETYLEEAARETIRMKAKYDQETVVNAARADASGRAQQERENIEVRLRELRARSAEERRTRLEAIEEIFTSMSSGAKALHEDPAKTVTLVGGLTALALGVYSSRAAMRVASSVLERHLGRPPLVRETSRWGWRPSALWPWSKSDGPNIFEKIVLEESLKERLQWTTNALLSAQQNGTPFRHLLVHGAPGTGKTLFARTLAKESGLDYAIMSGGDLGPLGREGPHELHKLFGWASRSRRGMVLFIDEADAFLRRRQGSDGSMGEDARNALSVFLHHTGTENANLAVIMATNIPSSLDSAVLDRVDEAFEFPIPQYDQRLHMLKLFVDRHIRQKTARGLGIEIDEAFAERLDSFLDEVAKRTEGLSGRQLAKLVLAFQSAVFGSGTMRLTEGLARTVLQWRLANPNA
mmetsp:Transcript_44415/g.125727  ORF Transcript_44415/g.125727 Transcript_44415/m.125727 type:complete len:556 (-) Transcript_44415:51-1718(-)